MSLSIDDPLIQATCALLVADKVIGTAWLCSEEGYLLTAGHLLGRIEPSHDVKVCFMEDRPRRVSVVYWNYQSQTGIDCAVLRLDSISEVQRAKPLRMRLTETANGTCRVRGYGKTLGSSSEGRATFLERYFPLDQSANFLFRLDSTELAEGGFSGAPVFSEELSAVVAIQIEGSTQKNTAGRDTVLAMPLYRVAGLWPGLKRIASPVVYEDRLGISLSKSRSAKERCQIHGLPARIRFVDQPYMVPLVQALEEANSRIALVGPSGNGKTDSAIEAAYRLAGSKGAPEHIVWVALGHDSQTAVGSIINRLAFELGFGEIATSREERKIATCLRILQGQSLLLIIDNLEPNNMVESAALVNFLRQLPQGIRVLITTTVDREQALGDFRRIRVPYLTSAPARAFALYQASRLDPPPLGVSDGILLDRLVRSSGGSPRSIILLLGVMRYMAPNQVLDAVEQLSDSLPSDIGDQRVVVQRFDNHLAPVWRMLTPTAKDLLLATTLFKNPASSEALAAASGLKYLDFQSAAEELVNAFLLETRRQHGTYRYELHQSTYLFALGRISETGYDTRSAIARLATFYTLFLRSHPEGAAVVEPDIPTILSVARWSAMHGETEGLLDLAAGSYDILFSLGLFQERIELAKLATRAAITQGNIGLAAFFVTVSASTETIIGNYAAASLLLLDGIELANTSQDSLRIAYMKRCIALNYYRQGDVHKAAGHITGLAEAARNAIAVQSSTDRTLEAHHAYIDILALEGAINYHSGAFEVATEIFNQMLSECETVQWKRAISYPLRDLAELAMVAERDFRKAVGLLMQAESIARDYKDHRQLGRIHMSFTKLYLHRGRLLRAADHYRQAGQLFNTMGLDNEADELATLYGVHKPAGGLWYRLFRIFQKPRANYSGLPVGGE